MLPNFSINLSYRVFLAISYLTTLLSLAKTLGTGANLSISSLCPSVFRLANFGFSARLLASTCYIFF